MPSVSATSARRLRRARRCSSSIPTTTSQHSSLNESARGRAVEKRPLMTLPTCHPRSRHTQRTLKLVCLGRTLNSAHSRAKPSSSRSRSPSSRFEPRQRSPRTAAFAHVPRPRRRPLAQRRPSRRQICTYAIRRRHARQPQRRARYRRPSAVHLRPPEPVRRCLHERRSHRAASLIGTARGRRRRVPSRCWRSPWER